MNSPMNMPLISKSDDEITIQKLVNICIDVISIFSWNIPIFFLNNIRLFAYSMCLLPGFLRCGWFYSTCDRRVEKYKNVSCRNYVDIYGATESLEHSDKKINANGKPVLLFFPGGAWVIGYKMWGALVAKAMVPFNILVIIPDYRNYPWACGPGMVQDVDDAIGWAHNNCARFGGNPDKIILFGESAGGHLCICALLRRVIGSISKGDTTHDWSLDDYCPKKIKGLVLLSSPFDLHAMKDSFSRKGISPHIINKMFGPDIGKYDPQRIIRECDASQNLASLMPPVKIFHGTADKTVPWEGSKEFNRSLQKVGITSKFQAYKGWSHTDPNLESIMDADNRFHKDLYHAIQEWTDCCENDFDDSIHECRRLCHRRRIQIGRWWNPF